MLTIQDIRNLGELINDTFGKSSTPKSPSSSLKCVIVNENTLSMTYTTIVTFATEHSLHDQSRLLNDESLQVTKDKVVKLKSEFKGAAGKALKLREISTEPSLEMIYLNPYAPLRRAYYKRHTLFELG